MRPAARPAPFLAVVRRGILTRAADQTPSSSSGRRLSKILSGE
jgi:hypothetical protein